MTKDQDSVNDYCIVNDHCQENQFQDDCIIVKNFITLQCDKKENFTCFNMNLISVQPDKNKTSGKKEPM